MEEQMALNGKTAVITGAARGLGWAYCQRLASDGANVVAVDIRDPAEQVQDLPGPGQKLGLACDLSRPEQTLSRLLPMQTIKRPAIPPAWPAHWPSWSRTTLASSPVRFCTSTAA
jgi:hypothetical protein